MKAITIVGYVSKATIKIDIRINKSTSSIHKNHMKKMYSHIYTTVIVLSLRIRLLRYIIDVLNSSAWKPFG